jgi:hypothetical protein
MSFWEIEHIIANFALVCSILYTALPPWEAFWQYPRFQSAYRFVMIFLLRFGSINFRSQVYQKIAATENVGGTGTPANPKTEETAT